MEKKIESMRRFGRITMWCPLIISMVLGILAILVSILGTTNPFFYTFANVPELYALETGGPFGGIKMAAIFIVIGFGFTVAGAILTCLAELMDGYSYVEEVEEETEEKSEEAKQEEKAHDHLVESHEERPEPAKETSEEESKEEPVENDDCSELRHAYDDVEIPVAEVSEENEAEEKKEQMEEPTSVEPEAESKDSIEETEEDVEEADKDEQYICPTFKAVYEKLPSGYQIKKGDIKRDPEIKGVLHFRIGNHYFKTTANGDIYDDEPVIFSATSNRA